MSGLPKNVRLHFVCFHNATLGKSKWFFFWFFSPNGQTSTHLGADLPGKKNYALGQNLLTPLVCLILLELCNLECFFPEKNA